MRSTPLRPPSVTIVLSFEDCAPRIYSDAQNEAEAARLCLWITGRPELAALLDKALTLREAWARRAA